MKRSTSSGQTEFPHSAAVGERFFLRHRRTIGSVGDIESYASTIAENASSQRNPSSGGAKILSAPIEMAAVVLDDQ